MDFSSWDSLHLASEFICTGIDNNNGLSNFMNASEITYDTSSPSSKQTLLTPTMSPYNQGLLIDPTLHMNAFPFLYSGTSLISPLPTQSTFPILPLTMSRKECEQRNYNSSSFSSDSFKFLQAPPKQNHLPQLFTQQTHVPNPSRSSNLIKRTAKEKKIQANSISTGSHLYSQPSKDPVSEEGEHRCPYPGCKKTFTRYYSLKSHLQCHVLTRAHVCELCDSAFTRKHDLQRHMRTLHEEGRPYKCPKCKQGFRRATSYWRHLLEEQQEIKDPVEMALFQQSVQAANGFLTNEFNVNAHQSVNKSVQPSIEMSSMYAHPNQAEYQPLQL